MATKTERCANCAKYTPINNLRGTCGTLAPVECWMHCRGWRNKPAAAKPGEQISIFELLDEKTILIKYQEQNGTRHAEKITTTNIKGAVSNWRAKHGEFYFCGIEGIEE